MQEESQVKAAPVIDDETELKQVHIIFRHGDRTPHYPYPNDPHKDHTYAPYGLGQLTKSGYMRMFKTGNFFRNRYGSFLGPLYKQNEIHAQSTGESRTRMSLQLLCAGLFPPADTDLEWNESLNWQPIDFISLPTDQDPLLLPISCTCPEFHEEVVRTFAPVVERNKELFEKLSEFKGRKIKQPFDIIGIRNLLKSQEECGLDLPSWTKAYYPEKLQELACEAWKYFVYNDALKKMLGGNFLEKLMSDWEAKVENKSPKKLFLYSAHESTVVSILGACNVWDSSNLPEYGIAVIFELRQNLKTGKHGVQLYVRNEPNDEAELLTIPGCKSFCSLDDFKYALQNHFPSSPKLSFVEKSTNSTVII